MQNKFAAAPRISGHRTLPFLPDLRLRSGKRIRIGSRKTLLPPSIQTSLKDVVHELEQLTANVQTPKLRIQKRLNPVLPDPHVQHIAELSNAEELRALQKTERAIDRNLKISLLSTFFAAGGAMAYLPLLVLSLPGILLISKDVMQRSYQVVARERRVNVDVLSSIAKIALLVSGNIVFCGIATILYSLNRKLLHRIKRDSQKCLIDIFAQQSKTVWIREGETEREIPTASLQQGYLVVVGTGEIIPADGIVEEGCASVDQKTLNGEAQPAEKEYGAEVLATTLVLSGTLCIRVTRTPNESSAAQIGKLLTDTIKGETDSQLRSERFSDRTVLPTLILSAITAPAIGFTSAAAILQSHFKYRMTIVSSIALLNYLRIAALRGILIKDGRAFERCVGIDTVVFDKTGTLTEEIPNVSVIHCFTARGETELLGFAAAAGHRQEHPVARAIQEAAAQRSVTPPALAEANYQTGFGVRITTSHGHVVQLGSKRFLEQSNLKLPHEASTLIAQCQSSGNSLVWIAIDGCVEGCIELQPSVRPEATEIVAGLRKQGIKEIIIISGDHDLPTRRLAHRLGCDSFHSETLPDKKSAIIKDLQSRGKRVCFIGDGINDSIAMQQADVSISLVGASSAAIDSAQVVLMDGTLRKTVDLFALSKEFTKNSTFTYAAIATPSLIGIAGTLFLGFGLTQAFILPQLALLVGVVISMRPLFRSASKELNHSRTKDSSSNQEGIDSARNAANYRKATAAPPRSLSESRQ